MEKKIDIDKFYECFVNALCVDREDLEMNKSLIEDLGADSIDFLDLVYQLEKAFNITIPQGELQRKVREKLSKDELDENDCITQKGVEKLKKELPELDFSHRTEDMLKLNDIPLLFTVGTFYKIVETQMKVEPKRN